MRGPIFDPVITHTKKIEIPLKNSVYVCLVFKFNVDIYLNLLSLLKVNKKRPKIFMALAVYLETDCQHLTNALRCLEAPHIRSKAFMYASFLLAMPPECACLFGTARKGKLPINSAKLVKL